MEPSSEIFLRILLTVVFGAILGIETETRINEISNKKDDEKSRIGGIRTYTILSLFGGIAGLLFNSEEFFLVYLTFISLILLIVGAYIENITLKGAFGMTTEVAILITFILGFFITSNLIAIEVNLFILVILAFFLSQKRGFNYLLNKVSHSEVIDIFKFGLVSLVILPLLPNTTYYIKDIINYLSLNNSELSLSENILNISIFNPFRLWLIVVVISGINLLAYILSRAIGPKRGILITATLGGIISSTSTTFALAQKSKKESKQNSEMLAGAALISNAVSLIAVLTLISILNIEITSYLYKPLLGMFLVGLIIGLFFIIKSRNKKNPSKIEIKYQPFSVGPALKFVAIVLLLTLIIQILQIIDVDGLLIIVTALSGIVGLDAPTIALSELFDKSEISLSIVITAFLATNTINFLSKAIIAYTTGNKEFRNKLLIGLIITLLGTIFIIL